MPQGGGREILTFCEDIAQSIRKELREGEQGRGMFIERSVGTTQNEVGAKGYKATEVSQNLPSPLSPSPYRPFHWDWRRWVESGGRKGAWQRMGEGIQRTTW
jgi:hypothetical protein